MLFSNALPDSLAYLFALYCRVCGEMSGFNCQVIYGYHIPPRECNTLETKQAIILRSEELFRAPFSHIEL